MSTCWSGVAQGAKGGRYRARAGADVRTAGLPEPAQRADEPPRPLHHRVLAL